MAFPIFDKIQLNSQDQLCKYYTFLIEDNFRRLNEKQLGIEKIVNRASYKLFHNITEII